MTCPSAKQAAAIATAAGVSVDPDNAASPRSTGAQHGDPTSDSDIPVTNARPAEAVDSSGHRCVALDVAERIAAMTNTVASRASMADVHAVNRVNTDIAEVRTAYPAATPHANALTRS